MRRDVLRYYFDVDDGRLSTVDDEGMELANPEHARREALAFLGALAKDALPAGTREITINVRNGTGAHHIFELRLAVEMKEIGSDA